jgi:nitroreductase
MSPDYRPVPLEFERLPPDVQLRRSRELLAVLRRRRTVRQFSDEPVPYELIENAIRAAASAPSGANQQPWTFVVVTDAEVRRQIRDAAEAEERAFYAGTAKDWHDSLSHLGTDWRKPHLTTAPYLIVVFAQTHGLGADAETGEAVKTKHYYVQESVGIAVGMFLTSLTHAGLATLTHTPSPMAFLARILERPANERAYVVIPVGFPAPDCTVPTITKKSIDEVMVVVGDQPQPS